MTNFIFGSFSQRPISFVFGIVLVASIISLLLFGCILPKLDAAISFLMDAIHDEKKLRCDEKGWKE